MLTKASWVIISALVQEHLNRVNCIVDCRKEPIPHAWFGYIYCRHKPTIPPLSFVDSLSKQSKYPSFLRSSLCVLARVTIFLVLHQITVQLQQALCVWQRNHNRQRNRVVNCFALAPQHTQSQNPKASITTCFLLLLFHIIHCSYTRLSFRLTAERKRNELS